MSAAWPMMPLGDVLSQYKAYIDAPEAKTYPKLSVKLYGKGVTLDAPTDGTTLKMKRHQLAKAGQVILSEIWGKKGAIGFVPPEGNGALCTSHFFLFDVNAERLHPKWLEYVFKANYLQEQLDAEAKGTTGYAAVRPAHLFKATIPLPPLADQRRLVERIDALAAKIEEAKSLRNETAIESGAFEHSFLNRVYDAMRTRFGLNSLAECCLGITDGTHLTPAFSEEGVRFIFVGNVSSGNFHFKGCKHVNPSYYATIASSRRPKKGDVLYSAVGATLGIPAVVDTDEEFCFQRHVAILKPDRQRLDSRYLWYMLRSGILYKKAWASITGTAQPTIPLKGIRSLPLPIPPIAEQQQIVLHLDRVHSKIKMVKQFQEERQTELDAMLPAILDRAFRGELL